MTGVKLACKSFNTSKSDMVKVALFSYSSSSDISGVTTWLLRFAVFLKVRGYDVVCLLHHLGEIENISPTHKNLSLAGVRVKEITRPDYMEERVRQVLEFLEDEQPAIFVPQCLFEGFYAGRIAGEAGLPWIMTLHSDEEDYWKPLSAVRPDRCRGSVVAVSKTIGEKAADYSSRLNVEVIPCGVSPIESVAKWNFKAFRIAYNGRVMEHQKRISLVIDTMIEACRLHPKVDCVVIGDGGDRSAMKQRVENAEFSDRIVFTGRLEPEEVRKKLAEAHAILLMSDFEGLPVALLEGMACGVVPIARRIPSGIPELVRDNETGILVDDCPQQTAKTICSLAENPEKWSKLSQNARRLFESEYSESVSFAKWKVLIDEWIRQAGSRRSLRIPRRWRLPKPIDSKMNPDIRRPPWYLKAYWKTRICVGALRRKWFLRSPQAKI